MTEINRSPGTKVITSPLLAAATTTGAGASITNYAAMKTYQAGTGCTTARAAAERASAAGQLLGECAGAYSELAQKADRHANDALMLQAAWPK